jgi:DNA-binding MarR family transcriptional regulator
MRHLTYYIRNRYIRIRYKNGDAMTRQPEDVLPLTPAVFHILLALYDSPKHGYAIMQEVKTVSSGTIAMGPGTLYGSIKRMLRDGLIEEAHELSDGERRFYRLTSFGQTATEAESRRLAGLVRAAQYKHALGDP